jgi:putative flippase GtrA
MMQRLARALRERFWLLVRYGVSGAFGAFVQTATLYVWVAWLHFHETYLVGAMLGFVLAVIITFFLQKYWTFRDRTQKHARRQLLGYTIVALINLGINVSLLALAKTLFSHSGVNFFEYWYLVIQVCIVLFASGVSFLLNYFFTFRHTSHAVDEALASPPLA